MMTIIGRIALLSLFCMSLNAYQISLSVHGMDNGRLEQAGVGQPFLVEVVIDQAPPAVGQPTIDRSDEVKIHSSGYHMRTLQGITQVTYQFRARIDQTGTFRIGPARLGTEASNTMDVVVGQQERSAASSKKAKGEEKVFLRLSVNKREAMMGERIKATVRFSASMPVELASLNEPDRQECAHINWRKKDGPITGIETIDGAEYSYAEWHFELYPEKSGTCVIPAFAADYIPYVRHNSFFNPFAGLINQQTQKRIYSNAISLAVDPLPDADQPINAIGHFKRFDATIDRNSARAGDGLVLKVELVGDSDWSAVKMPELIGISPTIKWYESKQLLEQDANERNCEKKTCEYIIQPCTAGTFTIPSQQFAYYDVVDRRVKTLKTQPITIAIVADKNNTANNTSTEKGYTPASAPAIPEPAPEKLKPLITDYYKDRLWKPIALPWFIFIIVITLVMIAYALLMQLLRFMRPAGRVSTKNQRVNRARAEILKAQEHAHYSEVYGIFVRLFAEQSGVPPTSISQEFIEQALRQKGASEYIMQQWSIFFGQLAECVYYDAKSSAARYPDLFARALAWIDTLKELL